MSDVTRVGDGARRVAALGVLIALCTGLAIALSAAASLAQQPSAAQQPLFCLWAEDLPTAPLELNTDFPRDPVEMNTAVVRTRRRAFVKTIKLDKEIFNCDETIVEVFLFTEIVEVQTRLGFKPVSKTFDAIACVKPSSLPIGHPRLRCGRLPAN